MTRRSGSRSIAGAGFADSLDAGLEPCEQMVDAFGCDPEALRSHTRLAALFSALISELDLHPVLPPVWHAFPGPGGLTGVAVLAESHLTCHTFPEFGTAAINLFCCRGRAVWDWERELAKRLGARRVTVRTVRRGN